MKNLYEKLYRLARKRSVEDVRYFNSSMLQKFIDSRSLNIEELGFSVEERSIPLITLGKGRIRILMWSQMHGNESTTTRAVLDMVSLFDNNETPFVRQVLNDCTLFIIPMLNPDGADAYTRENANGIDLNRDAKHLSQPESEVLRNVFNKINPDFCFNLHDQRTIYSVGDSDVPATLSFLSPSQDTERSISKNRKVAMQLIVSMVKRLEDWIPGQIGRYDDGYNDLCVGDAFQMEGIPTILFEAGHAPGDYMRKNPREYMFYALLESLRVISEEYYSKNRLDDYFNIPENKKLFFDILITNTGSKKDFGVLFEEQLFQNAIKFVPKLEKTGDLKGKYYGHDVFNLNNERDAKRLKMNSELYEIIKDFEK